MTEESGHDPRGFIGIGIYRPKSNLTTGMIVRAAACFGADYVVSLGEEYHGKRTDVGHSYHIPVFNIPSWEALEKFIPNNSEIVLVDYDESATSLERFNHPERCLYMIGNEGWGFPDEILENGHRNVYIRSEFCLNAGVSANMVLYNRYKRTREGNTFTLFGEDI